MCHCFCQNSVINFSKIVCNKFNEYMNIEYIYTIAFLLYIILPFILITFTTNT